MSDAVRSLETVTLAGAKRAAEAALSHAADGGWAVVAAVVGAQGELILVERMDGAVELAIDNAIAKARAAVTFKRDTDEGFEYLSKDPALFPPMSARPGILLVEGGKLFKRDDVIVGAIGISGAKHVVDHECAEAAAAALGL
jgi:glc operon protein GlcG